MIEDMELVDQIQERFLILMVLGCLRLLALIQLPRKRSSWRDLLIASFLLEAELPLFLLVPKYRQNPVVRGKCGYRFPLDRLK
jgi:hypothetical protein